MMHGYFEMGNVLCRVVSDTLYFMCKIHVLAVSMVYPSRIHAVCRHHGLRMLIRFATLVGYTNQKQLYFLFLTVVI